MAREEEHASDILCGSHEATVDAKGRLKIPTAFRRFLDETYGADFFVTSINDVQSVWVYPMPVWRDIAQKLAQAPTFDKSKRKALDQTTYWGQVARIDSEGRILIPAKLREPAAMQGEVMVLGQVNHMDVWNHERLREHIKNQRLTDEDLEKLSNLGI
ncbi:MAG: division/cell wall cluster transcriptional repressor MraZ [Acidobacteria bacterium]|nr:MAG: division/cell wall cluster transcriptional repressor MraZ [Acidobacteriota bacterium]